jgi:hypothetical protein
MLKEVKPGGIPRTGLGDNPNDSRDYLPSLLDYNRITYSNVEVLAFLKFVRIGIFQE